MGTEGFLDSEWPSQGFESAVFDCFLRASSPGGRSQGQRVAGQISRRGFSQLLCVDGSQREGNPRPRLFSRFTTRGLQPHHESVIGSAHRDLHCSYFAS